MRESAPALAHYFGVRPWEIELLTSGEIGAMERWLEEASRSQDGG